MVAKDVPPYAIVAGNPTQVVKMRFADEDIATLQALAWWDWPIDKITRNLHLISAGDVQALRDCE